MRLQFALCIVFGVWVHGVWLLSLPKQCGNTQGGGSSQLGDFIAKAIRVVSKGGAPICVIEVGTATVALNHALYERCIPPGGRSFDITSYEGMPEMAQAAASRWEGHDNVHIINELVITRENIQKYVLPAIEGAPDGFPDMQVYGNMQGNFFLTPPTCGAADLVLIDSTRYAHAGIVATLKEGLVHDETVFVVEDDSDVRAELEKHWKLRDVVTSQPAGEQWPWIRFRI